MYNPNCDIPKTLVRSLVEHEARAYKEEGNEAGDILYDILGTEVSPELLPAKDDKITQKTEDILGPYEHHDFFLYSLVKYGFAPSKIYRLAKEAFKEANEDELYRHLELFIKRFFTQQFKRSCSPDGVCVQPLNLSPRIGWAVPSDVDGNFFEIQ
jgi:NAD+ synthase (glutamine-hydrolysing)